MHVPLSSTPLWRARSASRPPTASVIIVSVANEWTFILGGTASSLPSVQRTESEDRRGYWRQAAPCGHLPRAFL